jgi:hypothetical protein
MEAQTGFMVTVTVGDFGSSFASLLVDTEHMFWR